MDKLDRYRIFVLVAETGSFTRAGQALDLPRASVSAALQKLESELGTRLLHRTTRRVSLTADGAQLLDRLHGFLAEADDIEHGFQSRQRQVAGRLHVDVPSRIARRLIAPALPELLRRYPRLQLRLGSSDRRVDLVGAGVDGVIRVGSLDDSSLIAQPLGRLALVNCASAGYLREHGMPSDADDLAEGHWSIGYASPTSGRTLPWQVVSREGLRELHLPSRVSVDNAETYIACCRAGLGLIQIPRYDVQHLLDSGELVEILPDQRAQALAVSALYPQRRQPSPRLTAFIDWFAALIRPHLEPAARAE